MIKQMVSRKLVNGIQLVDPEAVPKVCHSCVYGKQHRAPFPSPTNNIRAQKPGILFHNDLSGKMSIDSLDSHVTISFLRMIILNIDSFSLVLTNHFELFQNSCAASLS